MLRKLCEIKAELKEFLVKIDLVQEVASVYSVYWFIRHIYCNVMTKRRQGGYNDGRFLQLKGYERIHLGERCFIICTGPSLTIDDVNKLKNEYTFSVNSIIKYFPMTNWRPTYYVIDDVDVYLKLEKELMRYNLDVIFTSDILESQIHPNISFIKYPLDLLNHSLGMHITKPIFHFSENAYATLYHGYTVTFAAIQLAVYMGFKEIYLIGCDCNYSGEKMHFIDYGVANKLSVKEIEDNMTMAYKTAKEYADTHGIRIYNATRGGKLEIFERVDFDEIIK